jgi:hypothetical protein
MAKRKGQRERLHARDPHCYWCGRLTRVIAPCTSPDLATLEHLRSRFNPRRVNMDGTPASHGIIVLACYQCNNERGQIEQAFYSRIRARDFQSKHGREPASPELKVCQGKLLAAIVKFLGEGGELVGDGADDVLHWAGLVYDEWEKRRKPHNYKYA